MASLAYPLFALGSAGTGPIPSCSDPLMLRSGQETIMGIRMWVALASIAAAILVFCFAILGANMDPEGLPDRPASTGQIVRQAPPGPNTNTPR